jgi:hypothetical protein
MPASRTPSRLRESGEVGQRLPHRPCPRFGQRLGRYRVVAQHAGPAQHLGDRQRGGLWQCRAHAGFERHQLGQQLRVQCQLPAGFATRLQTGTAIDLAARQGAGDLLAQQGLDHTQFVGQPEMQVKETRINGSELKVQRRCADTDCSRRETRHAVYAACHAFFPC